MHGWDCDENPKFSSQSGAERGRVKFWEPLLVAATSHVQTIGATSTLDSGRAGTGTSTNAHFCNGFFHLQYHKIFLYLSIAIDIS
jgi:hypothetical protein